MENTEKINNDNLDKNLEIVRSVPPRTSSKSDRVNEAFQDIISGYGYLAEGYHRFQRTKKIAERNNTGEIVKGGPQ